MGFEYLLELESKLRAGSGGEKPGKKSVSEKLGLGNVSGIARGGCDAAP